jgi:hypothetical protein
MISGTLVLLGFILRRTSWENRITLVLLSLFAVAMFSLKGDHATSQYLAMAWPGVLVVGGIWLTGLLIGRRNGSETENDEPPRTVPLSTPAPVTAVAPVAAPRVTPMTAGETSLPPGTISPAPEVRKMMDDLMGGGK